MSDGGPRRACIVGVGETRYARWGGITDASEHALALEAILARRRGRRPRPSTTSTASRRSPTTGTMSAFLAADLGLRELRFANMVWMPGGGGGCAAVANAALAIESGAGRGRRRVPEPLSGAVPPLRPGPARAPTRRAAASAAQSLLEADAGFALPFGVLNAPIAYALVDAPPHAPLRHDERAAGPRRGDVPRARRTESRAP